MKIMIDTSFDAKKWFYVFIFTHLLFWTLVPALVRFNLPLDSIEGVLWGHHLEWGYDKNPFLNAWLTALANYLETLTPFHFQKISSGWFIYFFSQLSVVLCFISIWKLAKCMLSPLHALIAVMLLEAIQYFNFHAIDFNDNTLELSLWALTIYFFYLALTSSKTLWWILTGIFAGLSMMAKYYTLALLAALFLFLIIKKENHKHFLSLAPYLGLTSFLIVLFPHFFWLTQHHFITVNYVFDRAASTPHWYNRFVFPFMFSIQQLETFLPAVILYFVFFKGTGKNILKKNIDTYNFDRSFIVYVGLGPLLLTLLLSFLFDVNLRAGWGMPLLSTWGILLIFFFPPHINRIKLQRFVIIIFILMGLLLTGYIVSLTHTKTTTTANFPGKKMAAVLTAKWHEKYHTPLDFVAGSRWLGGNMNFYSPDHPSVFVEWNKERAEWIDIKKMQEKGALFLWDITDHETLPEDILKKYPHLKDITLLELPWHRDKNKQLNPEKIGIAFLPPAKNY